MAMTFNTTSIPLVQIPASGGLPFHVDAYCADVTGCEDIVAAVAGKSHYIKRIKIRVDGIGGTVTVTVGSGETTSAPTKIMVGPLSGSKEITGAGYAPASLYEYDFDPEGKNMGRKLTLSEALTIDSSAAVPVNVSVDGVTV